MVHHLNDIGLVHIGDSLLIIGMIHQDYVLTCSILKELRGLHLEIIKDILGLFIHFSRDYRNCIESERCTEFGIGNCSAYCVAVRIPVPYHICDSFFRGYSPVQGH